MTNKYYQKHKEKLQKETRERYHNVLEDEKEKMRKKARERYQNFNEEEREKKRQYHRERIKNLSKDQKQKLVEYMRNYYLVHKKLLFSRLTRSFFINLRTNGKKKEFSYQVLRELLFFLAMLSEDVFFFFSRVLGLSIAQCDGEKI